jgi:hypothetical protein
MENSARRNREEDKPQGEEEEKNIFRTYIILVGISSEKKTSNNQIITGLI